MWIFLSKEKDPDNHVPKNPFYHKQLIGSYMKFVVENVLYVYDLLEASNKTEWCVFVLFLEEW